MPDRRTEDDAATPDASRCGAGAAPERGAFGRRRRPRSRNSLLANGEGMVWLSGGSLAVCALMIAGLIALVLVQGSSTFWPGPLVELGLEDGRVLLGEVTREDTVRDGEAEVGRRLLRTGNFEISGTHFEWVLDGDVERETRPPDALLIERLAWGRFYGYPIRFDVDGATVATDPQSIGALIEERHPEVAARRDEEREIRKHELGALHRRRESARLAVREAELALERDPGAGTAALDAARARLEAEQRACLEEEAHLSKRLDELRRENDRCRLVLRTSTGEEKEMPLAEVVRVFAPNGLDLAGKIGVYASRWKEYLFDDPREANSEGGVWPAIVGTVLMTILMSIAVVPFGVLAALYLREYARAGPLISAVRIAVNNLAGVPSIVFGVFGLGFFCYIWGGSIDETFFGASLPNPTFGKGGVLWASLTLALLTLPVVVVSTEEALAAVPNSLREGSVACGASKWQTIRRIVLPRALPGIMTGFILAMARGAGEVAPLMLVGAVKLAPHLPIDTAFPFIHPERSFMHLGFHIYDVGFQSQNSEAAKPMVFTTTLLLIGLIAGLNIAAVWARTRLRRRFASSHY